jgi:hypothetical protein
VTERPSEYVEGDPITDAWLASTSVIASYSFAAAAPAPERIDAGSHDG